MQHNPYHYPGFSNVRFSNQTPVTTDHERERLMIQLVREYFGSYKEPGRRHSDAVPRRIGTE